MDGGMIDSELSDSMDRVSRFTGLGQDFCRAGFASECDWNSRFSGFEIGRFERVFPFNGFVDDGIDKVVGRSVGREQFDGRSRLLLPCREFDPRVLLNNLVFIEQKVRDLQGVVKEMIRESCNLAAPSGELQQQMVVEEIASIIVQVVSIARRLIHGGQQGDLGRSEANPVIGQLSDLLGTTTDLGFSSSGVELGDNNCNHMEINHQICARSMVDNLSGNPRGSLDLGSFGEGNGANRVEEPVYSVQEIEDCLAGYMDFADKTKDEYNEGEEENLRSCCYEILELEKEEILAPHTHFCLICGKGFKRDANLRMHMRGHGDIYKTPEALSNPNKGAELNNVHSRRYSCPFEGCKRNQKHKKFQPLKTILCVKNHYKRSHCDKSYVCSRCHSKRFSVLADLRTHEKHCGEDKWQCSCGTTFSRKDKLFGHVTLFQGHTPVVPVNEAKGGSASDDGAKIERKKNSEKIGTEVLTTDLGVNSNAVGQFISGPAPAPSADYSSTVGYENGEFLSNQSVLTNIRLPKEDNKPNYYNGILERMDRSPQSSPTLVGGPFSLHALLSCDFIEANGRSPNSDGV